MKKITLELPIEHLMILFMEAHNQNITFNQLVNDIFKKYIKEMQKDVLRKSKRKI